MTGIETMKTRIKDLLAVLKTAARNWWQKDPFRESAVIAFYAIFSLPGILVVVITIAGAAFGREEVDNYITEQIAAMLGHGTAEQIQDMVVKVGEREGSTLATIVGILTIFIGATGVFAEFQKSLNHIWEVKADPSKSGLWLFIRARLFSFGLIISLAFILMVSLIISAALSAFGDWLATNFSHAFHSMLQVLNFILSMAIITILFSLIYKILPDAKVKWRHVWIGAIVTAALFEVGKFLLGLYFGKADPGSNYGAAGSIILILLWVSYSSMLVFFGAEFTHAFAKKYSRNIAPNELAVREVTH
jgi:membrane protein